MTNANLTQVASQEEELTRKTRERLARILRDERERSLARTTEPVVYPKGGEAFYAIRTKMSLTQSGLAKFLGVSCPSISKWERGTNRPLFLVLRNVKGTLRQIDPEYATMLRYEDFGYEDRDNV